ncbi:hypothetical protein BaRGS_00009436 [Batillaria attramentaria]|uniref:Secreted protein n=1 Tax=Batillaria attramentaria TaxID=370345 RepID=A0ABD0LJJ6_9CAEN
MACTQYSILLCIAHVRIPCCFCAHPASLPGRSVHKTQVAQLQVLAQNPGVNEKRERDRLRPVVGGHMTPKATQFVCRQAEQERIKATAATHEAKLRRKSRCNRILMENALTDWQRKPPTFRACKNTCKNTHM